MDDDLDLDQLRSADTPELVRPAFSRFRRRIILVGVLVAIIAGVIGVGITYARTTSPELRLRRVERDLPTKLYKIKEGGSGSDRWAIFVHEPPQEEYGPCIRAAGAITTSAYCPLERNIGRESGKSVDYSVQKTGVAIDNTLVAATLVLGIAPADATKVTIVEKGAQPLSKGENIDSARARAKGFLILPTYKLDRFPYRFFGDILRTTSDIERVDAFDRSGRLIPPNPFGDARDIQPGQYGALNDLQKRAADAAVAASSDKDAVVLFSHGPYALTRALSMTQAAVLPGLPHDRQVILVELAGEFTWKRFARQDGRSTSRFAFSLVDTETMQILFAAEQAGWHGPPAEDLIRASLQAEPNQ